MQLENDFTFMQLAITQAKRSMEKNEIPIGCVIVNSHHQVLCQQHNTRHNSNSPIGHAEMEAICEAANKIGNWRLTELTLYTTLEPCLMCLSTMYQSRIKRVVFGAYDLKTGAISLGYTIFKDKRLNHNFQVLGGILEGECSLLMKNFFKERRCAHD